MTKSATREAADKATFTQAEVTAKDTAARAGRKNLIINGAMQVAQRGTTANLANGGSAYKTVDRFRIEESGAYTGAFTITQDTDSPLGFGSSLKWDCTTADTALAAGDALMMTYKPEAQDLQLLNYGTSGALQTTLSFWIKSNKTGTYVVWIYQQDGGRQVQVSYTVDVADTWEHKTCVIPAHTTVAINNDTGAGLYIRWVFGAGTNYTSGTANTTWAADVNANRHVGQTVNLADSTANYLNITGVQLETGSVATDFEHRSYGEILADCQRYCYVFDGTQNQDLMLFGVGSGTGTANCTHLHPVEMRSTPTLTTTAMSTFSSYSFGAQSTGGTPTTFGVSTAMSNKNWFYIDVVCSGNITGTGVMIRANGTATKLTFDAEL
jgi:hypothetical protein